MIREDLRINDWLELIKEDKNLNGAYISIAQYIYLTEKENQELKLELSGYRHAILNNKEMLGLKEQNDKLKKQIEEALKNYEKEAYIVDKQTRQLTDEYKNTKYQSDKVNSLLTQQKEFINYLEDMLDDENDIFSVVRVKDALQKYKEITGVKDE